MEENKGQQDKSSYKQIAAATGIFGGVQVVNILISVVRSKVIAVLLGTAGVGILGLFTATIAMIASISNLGLNFSAVRTISESTRSNDTTIQGQTIITLRRWINLTGIAGASVSLILAPQLSQWTFGNERYTWAFIWLSVTLFLQAVTNGQLALLQGLRRIKQLAKAKIAGAFTGLCVSLPLYFWLRIDGIVPALILTAIASLFFSWVFARRIKIGKVKISLKGSFFSGLNMVKLGSWIMISGFLNAGIMYLIRMYINRKGGVEEVGLYTAAWAIINNYVGLVFMAMGTDYFPRLSAINKDNQQVKILVNQQAEIAILILGPILILLLSFLPVVIMILLTSKFMPIITLTQWALIGVLLKAASWSVSIIFLAKGEGKLFFLIEMIGNLVMLSSNILFYHFYQLEGIGIAFTLSYLFYLVLVFTISRVRYGFAFNTPFLKVFFFQLILTIITFLVVSQIGFPVAYFLCIPLLLASVFYSYYEARKRLDLATLFKQIFRR
ncbi:MAG: O-antigen translocase [Bacteroidia bacterium]|nr:O-antigen translocase [Bacteroidia bacterium]